MIYLVMKEAEEDVYIIGAYTTLEEAREVKDEEDSLVEPTYILSFDGKDRKILK